MLDQLEQALNVLSLRQHVVANNLANVNTPGFTRQDVDFFGYMRQAFDGGEPVAEPQDDTVTPERLDGNNVTLEREVFALSQTELLFNAVSRFTSLDLDRLRYAITDGHG